MNRSQFWSFLDKIPKYMMTSWTMLERIEITNIINASFTLYATGSFKVIYKKICSTKNLTFIPENLSTFIEALIPFAALFPAFW